MLFAPLVLNFALGVSAFWTGYDIVARRGDGTCKTEQDFDEDFRVIRSWPVPTGGELAVRIFAVKDKSEAQDTGHSPGYACDTAGNIAGPAKKYNIKVMLGVWVWEGGDNHYATELETLRAVLRKEDCSWVAGVSVGSEDLFRKESQPQRLSEQIQEVKDLVRGARGNCKYIHISHMDIVSQWERADIGPVLKVVDFLSASIYPYFAGVSIDNALDNFKKTLRVLQHAAAGKPIVVSETGWPTAGGRNKDAYTSVENLKSYWQKLNCADGPLNGISSFWFEPFDDPSRHDNEVERNWGLATYDRKLKFELTCDDYVPTEGVKPANDHGQGGTSPGISTPKTQKPAGHSSFNDKHGSSGGHSGHSH